MEDGNDPIAPGNAVETVADTFLKSLGSDFRWELAFPELTESMLDIAGITLPENSTSSTPRAQ